MATELTSKSLVLVESSSFRQGMNDGALWYFRGDTSCRPITKADVMDFLQGNVVALVEVGVLDEDHLRSVAGFIIGWMAAQFLPPVCCSERIVI